MPADDSRFDLFISYVRRDVVRTVDHRRIDIVDELKRALELEIHPHDRHRVRPRRFRVCTDREDLDLRGTVSDAVRSAIGRSTMLLVVCSAGAPSSRYVAEEIAAFQSRETVPLAAFLDLSPSMAFPALYETDTLAVDLAVDEGATIEKYRRRLADEARKIVARVWGVSQSELRDRFAVQRRRQRRLAASAIGATVLIATLGVFLTATRFGLHAVHELRDGPRIVPPAGVGFVTGAPFLAGDGQLAVWRESRPDESTFFRYALTVIAIPNGQLVVREPERVVVTAPSSGEEHTVLAATGSTIAGLAAFDRGFAAVTADGRLWLGDLAGHVREAPRPSLTVGRARPPAFQKTGPLEWGATLAWDREGRWLASATIDGQLFVFDTREDRFLREDPLVHETENSRPIGSVAFVESPPRLLVAEGIGIRAVDLVTGEVTDPPLVQGIPLLRQLAPNPSGRVLVGVGSETLEVLSLENGRLMWRERVNVSPKNIPEVSWSPDGELLLVGYFDAAPDLFRFTYRAFGWDLWPPRAGDVLAQPRP